MRNRLEDVQAAAQARGATTINSETWANQIVTTAKGDARLCYEFLDILNAHVTRMLKEKKR